ncbi:MAG: hypothetical protein JW891_01610 [Candidatus Lokiarchaeota archaeon]|nr:hypothetical protein [Candidatus Lokiarchaeota archaeon]
MSTKAEKKIQKKQKEKEKNTQKIYNWLEKSNFWTNNVEKFEEIDDYTFMCTCKGLHLPGFRLYFEIEKPMAIIHVDVILPYKYHTEIGLGRAKVGKKLIKRWRFAPYEKPEVYSDERVADLIDTSHLNGKYDAVSEILNNKEDFMKVINKAPFAFNDTTQSGNTSTIHTYIIPAPLLIIQQENGSRIRFSCFFIKFGKKSKPDTIFVDMLDYLVGILMGHYQL